MLLGGVPPQPFEVFDLAPPPSCLHPPAPLDALDAPMSVMLPPAPPASELPEPEPPAKQCDECAAVKRLKGATSSDGLTAWHARPCVQCAIDRDKTGPQAPPAGVSSLCMRSALKEDLRPRRLFDLGGAEEPAFEDEDEDPFGEELELDLCGGCDADGADGEDGAGPSSLLPALGSPAGARPPSAHAMPYSPAAGTPMMADVDQLQLSVVVPESPAPAMAAESSVDADGGIAALPAILFGTAMPSALLGESAETTRAPSCRPRSASSEGSSFSLFAAPSSSMPLSAHPSTSSAMSDDVEQHAPPPPLPVSSMEAAAAARECAAARGGGVLQSPGGRRAMALAHSPGLAYAAARMIVRDGGGSSCATPSRTPNPGRPATPGAPGSNVRRTTSFIDGADEDGEDGLPHSITDSAVLLQLTQSLTSITLGSKRSFDDRD